MGQRMKTRYYTMIFFVVVVIQRDFTVKSQRQRERNDKAESKEKLPRHGPRPQSRENARPPHPRTGHTTTHLHTHSSDDTHLAYSRRQLSEQHTRTNPTHHTPPTSAGGSRGEGLEGEAPPWIWMVQRSSLQNITTWGSAGGRTRRSACTACTIGRPFPLCITSATRLVPFIVRVVSQWVIQRRRHMDSGTWGGGDTGIRRRTPSRNHIIVGPGTYTGQTAAVLDGI